MRFLFIGSRFTLHASFPRSVTLTQLRLTLLTVTSSQRDLHPQVCAHAGRTNKKTWLRWQPGLLVCEWERVCESLRRHKHVVNQWAG
ncbi:hypothetical protein FQZ97_1189260 [compost metagenome]